jgi:deazaflavin-dependent oxidoreductase (nitroreductase family)
VPSDFAFKALNAVHGAVLRVSRGKVGGSLIHMPVIELTTVGRKTGLDRSVLLTSPVQEGDTIVVVASRAGDPKHPAWFLNLRDDPTVTVRWKGGDPQAMTATIANDEQRLRIWPKVVDAYGPYAKYEARTERQIPLVLLDAQ